MRACPQRRCYIYRDSGMRQLPANWTQDKRERADAGGSEDSWWVEKTQQDKSVVCATVHATCVHVLSVRALAATSLTLRLQHGL